MSGTTIGGRSNRILNAWVRFLIGTCNKLDPRLLEILSIRCK